MNRLHTGVTGLDDIIEGGYPKGRTMLILGPTGSGKTILGISFIQQACSEGRKSMIIATEELPEDILMQSESVGKPLEKFFKKGILLIDKVYEERTQYAKELQDIGIEGIDRLQTNILGLLERIPVEIECVVIDNLGVFILNMSPNEFRGQFDSLIVGLTKRNITAIIIMDLSADSRTENIASYSVYGVLRALIKDNPFTEARERLLEILKIRNTKISLDPIRFDITAKGIELMKK
ncbi:MAG: ATP-binding protein [Candidatus Methanoperedens sp.]|nr:ATP-binding protein [Candidatus Methanoperedens sp.]